MNDNPDATAEEMWGDVLKGRLSIFTELSEPYAVNLMGSKLAYVFQRDVVNPDKVKRRYISDPINEVNGRIDNDRNPQCVVPHTKMLLEERCDGNVGIIRYPFLLAIAT